MKKKSQLMNVLAGRAGLFVKFDNKQKCKLILGLYLNCKSITVFK